MFSIAEHLNDFFDWISTLSFSSIVNTYWFLFFIEMPRYYILEYLVIGNRLMKRNRLEKEKEYAKYFLYRENPLISILVPGKNEGKHIFKMVNSLAEQTYRNYEIIEVLALGYFIRVCFSQLAFILVLLVSERKRDVWFLYRYLPLMSPYTGYFLRIARLSAHLQELFFRRSYKDAWNPEKTSRYAQLEGI